MKKMALALLSTAFLAGIYSFTGVTSTKEVITYKVEAGKSRVDWVGSKKNDFHTGFFNVKSGSVQVNGGKVTGGEFVIDLANLKVTDAAGAKLEGHLKAADFFEVAKYGEATYKITNVVYNDETNATITGELNLKGASLPVSFKAAIRSADEKGLFAEAFFAMDRTLFGINYGVGNIAKDVQVAVHLYATK
jgi:polyisoprenoid-binding protein YceI